MMWHRACFWRSLAAGRQFHKRWIGSCCCPHQKLATVNSSHPYGHTILHLSRFAGVYFLTAFLAGCIPRVIQSPIPIPEQKLDIVHSYKIPPTLGNRTPFHDAQLEQLLAVALQDNLDMKTAVARIAQARYITDKSRTAFFPAIDLKASDAQYHFDFQGVVPPEVPPLLARNANIGGASLNFNYELDLWGKNRAIFSSRVNELLAAKMDRAETRLIVSASISSAFFDWQNNRIQQKLAKENVRIAKELEDIVLDRAKQGVESDIPVKTAITTTQSARLTLENYKRTTQESLHQLIVLMGKNPFNTRISPTSFRYSPKELAIPSIVPANLLAQRPDIAATRARAEAAAHRIKVAKTAFLPNINLSALVSAQSFYFTRLFHLAFETEGAKVALELPIFDAGLRKANLGVAWTEFEVAVNQYNQTILNALQETADEIIALRTLQKQVDSQQKALDAARQNYHLFQARYRSGIIDYVQLLEIKQVMIQQESTLRTLQTRQKQAFVGFLAATGQEIYHDR